jgi:hypothetical protein
LVSVLTQKCNRAKSVAWLGMSKSPATNLPAIIARWRSDDENSAPLRKYGWVLELAL